MKLRAKTIIAETVGWLVGIYMFLGAVATGMSPPGPDHSRLADFFGGEVSLAIFSAVIGWTALMLLYAKARRFHRVEKDAYFFVSVVNFFILLLEIFVFKTEAVLWVESVILIALSVWLYLRK